MAIFKTGADLRMSQTYRPLGPVQHRKPPAALTEAFFASMRSENPAIAHAQRIGAMTAAGEGFWGALFGGTPDPEPGYSPFDYLKGTRWERHMAVFAEDRSREETHARIGMLEQWERDQETLRRSDPGDAALSMLAAGVLDPLNVIPFGAAFRGLRRFGLFKRVAAAPVAHYIEGAAGGALSEAALSAINPFRAPEEWNAGVEGAAALSALLGTAVAPFSPRMLVSPSDIKRVFRGDLSGGPGREGFRNAMIMANVGERQADYLVKFIEAGPARALVDKGVFGSVDEFWDHFALTRTFDVADEGRGGSPDEVLAHFLRENGGGVFSGAMDIREDGRAVIAAVRRAADLSTFLHETAHVIRKWTPRDDLKVLEDAYGVVDGNWTRDAEERYVQDVQTFLRGGEIPRTKNPELLRVFRNIKDWLRAIFNTVRPEEMTTIAPEVREIIRRYWEPEDIDVRRDMPLIRPPAFALEPAPFLSNLRTFDRESVTERLRESVSLFQRAPDTPEFRAWYGNSKAEGVFYHGSASVGFDWFDPLKVNGINLYGPGFYFTRNSKIASSYTENKAYLHDENLKNGGVYPVYLSIQNPLDMDALIPADEARRILQTLIDQDHGSKPYFRKQHDWRAENEVPYEVYKEHRDAARRRPDIHEEIDLVANRLEGEYGAYGIQNQVYMMERGQLPERAAERLKQKKWWPEVEENLLPLIRESQRLYDWERAHQIPEYPSQVNNALRWWQEQIGEGGVEGKDLYEMMRDAVNHAVPQDESPLRSSDRWINDAIRQSGYDGITHIGAGPPGHRVYVAFRPTQIKSVFNYGSFSPDDARILYQRAPHALLFHNDGKDIETRMAELFDKYKEPPKTRLAEIPGAPKKSAMKYTIFKKKGENPDNPTSYEGMIEWALREWGDAARFWYDDSAQGVKRAVKPHQFWEASIVIGFTSPQTDYHINIRNAWTVMWWMRKNWARAEPIIRMIDKYPRNEALKDPQLSAHLENFRRELKSVVLTAKGEPWNINFDNKRLYDIFHYYLTGEYLPGKQKVSTFATMFPWVGGNNPELRSVQGQHMALLFGYPDAAIPNDDAYRWSQALTGLLAERMGLRPQEAQALLWMYRKHVLSRRAGTKAVETDDKGNAQGTWAYAWEHSQPEYERFQSVPDVIFPVNRLEPERQNVRMAKTQKTEPFNNSVAAVRDRAEVLAANSPHWKIATLPGLESGFKLPETVTPVSGEKFHRELMSEIRDGEGHIPFLRELRVPHKFAYSRGSWDFVEPGFFLHLWEPGEALANSLAAAVAHGLGQDSFLDVFPRFDPKDPNALRALSLRPISRDMAFTPSQLSDIMGTTGESFSEMPNGDLLFLFFPPEGATKKQASAAFKKWHRDLSGKLAGLGYQNNLIGTRLYRSDLAERGDYRERIEQPTRFREPGGGGGVQLPVGGGEGIRDAPAGTSMGSNLYLARAHRDLLRPLLKQVARRQELGWGFDPERFAEASKLTDEEANWVRQTWARQQYEQEGFQALYQQLPSSTPPDRFRDYMRRATSALEDTGAPPRSRPAPRALFQAPANHPDPKVQTDIDRYIELMRQWTEFQQEARNRAFELETQAEEIEWELENIDSDYGDRIAALNDGIEEASFDLIPDRLADMAREHESLWYEVDDDVEADANALRMGSMALQELEARFEEIRRGMAEEAAERGEETGPLEDASVDTFDEDLPPDLRGIARQYEAISENISHLDPDEIEGRAEASETAKARRAELEAEYDRLAKEEAARLRSEMKEAKKAKRAEVRRLRREVDKIEDEPPENLQDEVSDIEERLTEALGGGERGRNALRAFDKEAERRSRVRPLYQPAPKTIGDRVRERLSPEAAGWLGGDDDIARIPGVGAPLVKYANKLTQVPSIRMYTTRFSGAARPVFERLANIPFLLKKNEMGIKTANSVDYRVVMRTNQLMGRTVGEIRSAFVDYRARMAGETAPQRGTVQSALRGMKYKIADLIARREEVLTSAQFRETVWREWGGEDTGVPEAKRAAAEARTVMDELEPELRAMGLLPKLKEGEQPVRGHRPRAFVTEYVRRYPKAFIKIVEERMAKHGFKLPEGTTVNDAVRAILRSPRGVLWNETQSEAGVAVPASVFLEARMFDFPDEAFLNVDIGDGRTIDFIDTDAERLLNNYFRSVIPDLEITREFGDLELTDALKYINDEYDRLVDEAEGDVGPIEDERKAVLADVIGARDVIRGTYGKLSDPDNFWARAGTGLLKFNTLSYLGGVTLASIPDLGRIVMKHGFGPFKDALRFTFGNNPEWAGQIGNLRRAGVPIDLATSMRLFEYADLTDLRSGRTGIERALDFASDQFGILTLMDVWNTRLKMVAGVAAASEVVRVARRVANGSPVAKEKMAWMASIGLDETDLRNIALSFDNFGETHGGLHLPHVDQWTGETGLAAARALDQAVFREVEATIVTPHTGDRPLLSHTMWGKIFLQFKSFGLTAVPKIVLAGIQQRDKALAAGALFSLGLGAVAYTLKQYARGNEPTDDPDAFLVEAIDNSGLLGIFLDFNGMVEQMTRGRMGIHPMVSDEGSMSRWAGKGFGDLAFGPTYSTLDNAQRAMAGYAGAMLGGDLDSGTITKTFRVMPYSRLFYLRRYVFEPLRESAIENFATEAER